MYFRLLTVILVVVIQFHCANFQAVDSETWEKAEKKCQSLSKLDTSEKASLLTSLGNISRTAKCYVNCFFEEVGLMIGASLNNTLLHVWLEEEASLSQDADLLYNNVKTCIDNIKTSDKCDLAYELYRCFENRIWLNKKRETKTVGSLVENSGSARGQLV
ncbi:hypothetical protein O3M35_000866 [Rhynocoris fuscipes]|uniref:Uncharacterized protein n=1 Tax=Rhynocoris fuscipes TaxID=488301 RepID=A0AAW1DTF5_9HEMI